MRKVYIFPNLVTSGSLFCGLMAIYETLEFTGEGDLVRAFYYLIAAGILDVFDGLVARLTNAQSTFGLNFDSLSDVIVFGVAPAMIVYTYVQPVDPMMARASCAVFTVCGALRLARYNVQSAREESIGFLGLPIPGAGAVAVSLVWVLTTRSWARDLIPIYIALPPAMFVLSALMVSTLPYGGIKSLVTARRQPFHNLVQVVCFLFFIFALKEYFDIISLTLFSIYASWGPFVYLRRRRARSRARNQPPASAELPEESTESSAHPGT